VVRLKAEINSDEICEQYKESEQDFTRKRVLGFARVIVMILSGKKLSLQNSLNKFFSVIGEVFKVPTDSAYCQAKQKVKPEIFVHLTGQLNADYYRLYGADEEVKLWRGHRLIGGDGTKLNLPDTPDLRASFGVQRNQTSGEQGGCVQATAVVAYDLLNDLGLQSALGKAHSSEKSLLFEVWSALEKGDVWVLDRNFADYSIIAKAKQDGLEMVVRCPHSSFSVVEDFWASKERERIVWLPVSQCWRTRKYVKEQGLAEEIEVRLLKFRLKTGEEEVLLTTLCDQKKYPRREFFKVYGIRWNNETYFDRIKNIFEVERFSGQSESSLKQDFYGVLFLANLESVLSKEVETQMQEMAQERENETLPQVNHAISYVALVSRVAFLLADENKSSEETLKELKHLFWTNPTRHRKGRKQAREKPTSAQQVRYYRYSKRIIA